MPKKKINILTSVLSAIVVIGIIGFLAYTLMPKEHEGEDVQSAMMPKEVTVVEVDTIVLTKLTFQKQTICNGKLVAAHRAELVCPNTAEVLLNVNVKNGQRVSAGSVLVVTETRDRKRELEKAKRDLERAKVELQDKLIALGFDGNEKNVPAEVLRRAEVTSGYYSAKYTLQSAEKSLADCKVLAPFAGRIADLQARPHQRCDKLCTLIDDSFFDVEFQILEAELASVCIGTTVRVAPFIDEQLSFVGNVTEINPTIDTKGLVAVKARVKNTSNKLLDGMNVKVVMENSVPDMLVVPKEAVVERDGYHVVFVYDKRTGRAIWTYVDIMYSNLESYAITGCERKNTTIKAGDVVIVSGNLNLADDTEVKVVHSK